MIFQNVLRFSFRAVLGEISQYRATHLIQPQHLKVLEILGLKTSKSYHIWVKSERLNQKYLKLVEFGWEFGRLGEVPCKNWSNLIEFQ